MRFKSASLLDLGEHLAAVLLGQVQVEQDQVRARAVARYVPWRRRKARAVDPVLDDVKRVEDLGLLERLAGQAHVGGAVLDQQDVNGADALVGLRHGSVVSVGNA